MSWRVQYRERTPKGEPGKVKWEEGHEADGAAFKVNQLLAAPNPPCWIVVEDLESKHKGSSAERPKPTKAKKK